MNPVVLTENSIKFTFLKLKPPDIANTLPLYGSITTIPPFTLGNCFRLNTPLNFSRKLCHLF